MENLKKKSRDYKKWFYQNIYSWLSTSLHFQHKSDKDYQVMNLVEHEIFKK